MYKPIQIDREKLSIMGVLFPDIKTLDNVANAIGSNMFEGFEPTESQIMLIRDYVMNKISFLQLVETAKNTGYA